MSPMSTPPALPLPYKHGGQNDNWPWRALFHTDGGLLVLSAVDSAVLAAIADVESA